MPGRTLEAARRRRVDTLLREVADDRDRVLHHPVYRRLDTVAAVRAFLDQHVFAVWDYGALTEVLRGRIGPGPAVDVHRYAAAMDACGADSGPVRRFVALVDAGVEVRGALVMAEAPAAARRFVTETGHTVNTGSVVEQAALLCFGRDELAPEALRRVAPAVPAFHRYLGRHLAPDGGAAGRAAVALLGSLCEDDDDWQLATATAGAVLAARSRLLDGIQAAVGAAGPAPVRVARDGAPVDTR